MITFFPIEMKGESRLRLISSHSNPLLSVSRFVDDFGRRPDVHVFFKQRILPNDHHTEIGVEAHSPLDDILNRSISVQTQNASRRFNVLHLQERRLLVDLQLAVHDVLGGLEPRERIRLRKVHPKSNPTNTPKREHRIQK